MAVTRVLCKPARTTCREEGVRATPWPVPRKIEIKWKPVGFGSWESFTDPAEAPGSSSVPRRKCPECHISTNRPGSPEPFLLLELHWRFSDTRGRSLPVDFLIILAVPLIWKQKTRASPWRLTPQQRPHGLHSMLLILCVRNREHTYFRVMETDFREIQKETASS